jgi:hypothetical protein
MKAAKMTGNITTMNDKLNAGEINGPRPSREHETGSPLFIKQKEIYL